MTLRRISEALDIQYGRLCYVLYSQNALQALVNRGCESKYHQQIINVVNRPFKHIANTESAALCELICTRVCGGKFDIPFGVDEFLPGGLAVGAIGAVGSTYNYAAPLYLDIIDAFNKGDQATVAALMDKVIGIIRPLVQYGGVAAGKAAMQLHGIDVGDPRLPIRALSATEKEEVVVKMKAAGFMAHIPAL